MQQVARNLTDAEGGALLGQRYLLHDRDTKYFSGFRSIVRDAGVEPRRLPPSSPDLNAFAERWVRSEKQECLSKLILFGEAPLRRAFNEYLAHFHAERPHQGKGNLMPLPSRLTEPALPIASHVGNVWEACSATYARAARIFWPNGIRDRRRPAIGFLIQYAVTHVLRRRLRCNCFTPLAHVLRDLATRVLKAL